MIILYKTTNTINGKIYIGVRKLTSRKSIYLGSGVAIKRAIQKYGKENFVRETLFEFDTAKEAFAKEAEIVNEEFVSRKDTYNIGLGGQGGDFSSGRKLSEEHKAKISKSLTGRKLTQDQKTKISESMIGLPPSKGFTGMTHSDKTLSKMSKSAKARKKIQCPNCKTMTPVNVAKRWHFDNCKVII